MLAFTAGEPPDPLPTEGQSAQKQHGQTVKLAGHPDGGTLRLTTRHGSKQDYLRLTDHFRSFAWSCDRGERQDRSKSCQPQSTVRCKSLVPPCGAFPR